jgi:hypothetical protein
MGSKGYKVDLSKEKYYVNGFSTDRNRKPATQVERRRRGRDDGGDRGVADHLLHRTRTAWPVGMGGPITVLAC